MDSTTTEPETVGGGMIADIGPGTLQQYVTLLLERLASSHLPELGGIVRVRGRWADPGRPSGRYFYGARLSDDGGAHAKVEILAALVTGRGIVPGQHVVVTGRLAVRATNYGIEARVAATDIALAEHEEPVRSELAPQGRMTIERLRTLSPRRVAFPESAPVPVTIIQSGSALAQVSHDCMEELAKLSGMVVVRPLQANMLDAVAIASAIRAAPGEGILVLIRGGGDAADFEVFDDPRVVTALAQKRVHRVLGLGHTGNATLLDLVADYSANTPGQAGAYIRERIEERLRQGAEAVREVRLVRERLGALEKERDTAWSQLESARELLRAARGRLPLWVALAAFLVGAALAAIIR